MGEVLLRLLCSPHRVVLGGDSVVPAGLGHGFKGLQYEVGLVDEPVCADEDIYCPGKRRIHIYLIKKQLDKRPASVFFYI